MGLPVKSQSCRLPYEYYYGSPWKITKLLASLGILLWVSLENHKAEGFLRNAIMDLPGKSQICSFLMSTIMGLPGKSQSCRLP